MLKIKPLRDQVIVKRKEEETKSAGGIIIPTTAQEPSIEGEVLAVGSGKLLDNGTFAEILVKPGDRVLLPKHGFIETTLEGEKYLIIREENIIATLG